MHAVFLVTITYIINYHYCCYFCFLLSLLTLMFEMKLVIQQRKRGVCIFYIIKLITFTLFCPSQNRWRRDTHKLSGFVNIAKYDLDDLIHIYCLSRLRLRPIVTKYSIMGMLWLVSNNKTLTFQETDSYFVTSACYILIWLKNNQHVYSRRRKRF